MNTYDKIITDLIINAKRAFPEEHGDYKNDGLLYCGKCDTPKQCCVEKLGNAIVPCACQCKQEELERVKRDTDSEAAKRYIARLRENAFGNTGQENCRFESSNDTEAVTILKNYAESFPDRLIDGKGVLLYGGTGVGKSHAAACLVNELVNKMHRCKFTNFARLFGETDWDNRQIEIDALDGFDLLVIDDLGAERDTETMTEFKWNVIDGRVNIGLPMVLTTNLSVEDFKTGNPKLFSRLYKACYFHEIKGSDIRKDEYRATKDAMKKMLGIKEEKL